MAIQPLINTTMLCFPHLTSVVFFSIAFILYRFQKNKFDVEPGKVSIEAFIKRGIKSTPLVNKVRILITVCEITGSKKIRKLRFSTSY